MALFQPTNITPDLKGGVKNGFILIPSGVITPTSADISWSVNGNSTMTAYKIDFYQNTAASTLTGTTGKITLGTPFSAISADGTQTRFTATVAWSLISDTYSGLGTLQGKFKITQWWGSGANDYVEQKSLSVFEVSKEGGVSIIPPTGYGGHLTFNAVYYPPVPSSTYGNVPLNWIRWEIFRSTAQGTPVYDSGKIWNATSYTWSPSVLSPGDYTARFTAEAGNGSDCMDVEFFSVSASDITTVEDALNVSCDHEHDAVKIGLCNTTEIIEGEESGNVSVGASGEIILSDYWASEQYNVAAYSSDTWSFIWHGKITGTTSLSNNRLFIISSGSMTPQVYVTRQSGKLNFYPSGNQPTINYTVGDELWIIFTSGFFLGGISTGYQWLVYSPNASGYYNWDVPIFTEQAPRHIELFGNTTVYGFQLGFGTGNASLDAGMNDQSAETVFGGPKVEYPWSTTIHKAVWLPFGSASAEVALYRMEGPYYYGAAMTLAGIFPISPDPDYTAYILDYGAVNGKSYTYVVTSADENLENEARSMSGAVSPCFWNWMLIEARQNASNEKLYEAVNLFRFQGNVSSGSYGNGGGRNIQPTFTPYPAVLRSTQNRRQGTLTGLIGFCTGGEYSDSNETERAIRALSTSRNQLFLRDRRGNLIKIALAGEISMSVNDNSAKQEITVSVPWVEIGPTDGVSVFESGWDSPEPEE